MRRAVSDGVLPTFTPDGLEGLLLRLRGAGRARHDRARVAHRLALGGGEARDVADDRLGDVVLDVRRRALLGVAADLADHHDRVGLGVGLERRERVDVRGADDRVAADADGRGEAEVTQLVHHLVGQRARLGHQADAAGLGDGAGDDAGVGLPGADEAGAVRADDPRGARVRGVLVEPRGVVDRDALGDHDDERDRGVDRLDHGGLGELRRHEHHRDVGAGGGDGLLAGVEDRDVAALGRDGLAALAGGDARDDVGVRPEHAERVLGALGAGDALDEDLAVLGEEDRHRVQAPCAASCGHAARGVVHGVHELRRAGCPRRRGSAGRGRRCCRRAGRRAAW